MESTRQLVCAFLDALAGADVESALSFFSLDGSFQEAGRQPLHGHPAIRERLVEFVSRAAPWKMIVDEVIEGQDGERAAVTYRFIIENEAGEPSERPGCAVIRRSGRRFVQWKEYRG